MPDFTTRLGMYLPGGGASGSITPDETADIDKLNNNFRAIDTAIGSSIVTSTTRPATPFQGQLIYETDTGLTLMRQGSQWIPIGGDRGYRFVQRVIFTSTGTFTKASYPWLRAIRVRAQGAGGGSGGVAATGAGQWAASSGGVGGNYAESLITDIAGLDALVTVTVGAGGAAGAAGGNGGTGGNSSFGSLVVAVGGPSGLAGTARTPSFPSDSRGADTLAASGGNTGEIVILGGDPEQALYAAFASFPTGAAGGSSMFGRTGAPNANGNAVAGIGYGGGARGAMNTPSQAAKAGAAGAPGIVILELFA